jgi:dihydropyrimidine dehydrogenase (NAD+) subunit PreA
VVCPVEECIALRPLTEGVTPRTGVKVGGHRTWLERPNNPGAKPTERALEPAE